MAMLSVIIPVYNCITYLRSCVESVTAVNSCGGEPRICEILLVDDGSTDGSSALCDELAERYSGEPCRIRVIHQENSGVSAARNAGLRAAAGDYVLFVDSDDTVDAAALAELLDEVAAAPETDMAVFGMSFDYYHGTKIFRRDCVLPPVQGLKSRQECEEILYQLYFRNSLSAIWNKVIRKELLTGAELFLREDMFLYEDLEFSLRVLANCDTVYFFPNVIYHYRQAEGGGNAGRRLLRIEHIPELLEKISAAMDGLHGEKERILFSLHTNLAREKTACASRAEIETVCADYRAWVDAHSLRSGVTDGSYAAMLYHGQIGRLLLRRRYTKIRHAAADRLKQWIGDFRTWKFRS